MAGLSLELPFQRNGFATGAVAPHGRNTPMKTLGTCLARAMCPRNVFWVALAAATAFAGRPETLSGGSLPEIRPEERLKIEQAIPAKAPAAPKQARKLLVFTLNVGYGDGHLSIPYANLAFTLMGKKTGAFETVVSRDPEMFRPRTLRQFDAVFFNNTVGNLFTDAELRRSLLEFVSGGGGLL